MVRWPHWPRPRIWRACPRIWSRIRRPTRRWRRHESWNLTRGARVVWLPRREGTAASASRPSGPCTPTPPFHRTGQAPAAARGRHTTHSPIVRWLVASGLLASSHCVSHRNAAAWLRTAPLPGGRLPRDFPPAAGASTVCRCWEQRGGRGSGWGEWIRSLGV